MPWKGDNLASAGTQYPTPAPQRYVMWLEINFVIELNVFIITDYHYLKAF
jgi:hypothetical protein